MPDVDIVIVNWNSGRQLAECLRSVALLETRPVFQLSKCIVVDNASEDGSADGLEEAPLPVVLLRNDANRGFGAACNRGAASGQAEYVLFLNPDSRLVPESVGGAISFLEAGGNERIGLLGIQLVDDECHVQPSTARFPTPGALLYQMVGLDRLWPARFPPFIMVDRDHSESRQVDVLQGAFLLVRRSAFEQLNGFDEHFFIYYEDVDLACRARQAGWKSYYFSGAQVYHRGGGTTEAIKARRLSYWLISRVRYIAKHFGRGAALRVAIASFTLELGARVTWNLVTLSWAHLLDTLRAYWLYGRALGESLRM